MSIYVVIPSHPIILQLSLCHNCHVEEVNYITCNNQFMFFPSIQLHNSVSVHIKSLNLKGLASRACETYVV